MTITTRTPEQYLVDKADEFFVDADAQGSNPSDTPFYSAGFLQTLAFDLSQYRDAIIIPHMGQTTTIMYLMIWNGKFWSTYRTISQNAANGLGSDGANTHAFTVSGALGKFKLMLQPGGGQTLTGAYIIARR